MLLHSERAIMGFFFHFSCLEMVMMADFPLLIWRKKIGALTVVKGC